MIPFLVSLIVMMSTPDTRVVEIHAKRFSFSPDTVTLKRGEHVTVRLISDDRAHGLLVKPLGIELDASPNAPDEISIVAPAQAGTYPAICDHYCGMGHGGMKMQFAVE
jgi:cytochrome c oxidase subunit 2